MDARQLSAVGGASHEEFMRAAIRAAGDGMRAGRGGPFGCVIVRGGAIVGRGENRVTSTYDPTAHAEIVAIRAACSALGTYELRGCNLYASCEPCPMCFAAIHWARIPRVFYGNTRADAAAIAFDDDLLYQQVALPPGERTIVMTPLLRDEALATFREWAANPDRRQY